MLDDVPQGDIAIYVFLEMVALGFVLEAVSSLARGDHWLRWAGLTLLGVVFFFAGIKWPAIKKLFFAPKGTSEPEPTLLSLMDTSFPRFHKKWHDATVKFDNGSSLQVRTALYFDLDSNGTFLGFHLPSSPDTVSACLVLANQAREIAQQLAGAGLLLSATRPGEPTQELKHFGFTGKVYLYHEDRLAHGQMGKIEEAFHAQKLAAILRGPDFLTPAWMAWMERKTKTAEKPSVIEPNVTFDDTKISIQKVVNDGGRLRLFVPNEKATFMFAATIEVRNHAVEGKQTASAGQVKAQLGFKLTQGTYEVAPGAWLDEPYSSVHLDVGDTRRLILAVSDNWIQDWRMVTNKRTGPTDALMLDYSRDFPLLAKGNLEVSIVGSGRVLRKLKARVEWKHNENLMLVPMEEGKPQWIDRRNFKKSMM